MPYPELPPGDEWRRDAGHSPYRLRGTRAVDLPIAEPESEPHDPLQIGYSDFRRRLEELLASVTETMDRQGLRVIFSDGQAAWAQLVAEFGRLSPMDQDRERATAQRLLQSMQAVRARLGVPWFNEELPD